ncbi:hypothetical protein GW750_00170 [bacterium]|nr:hypothetical protein [bacterium]
MDEVDLNDDPDEIQISSLQCQKRVVLDLRIEVMLMFEIRIWLDEIDQEVDMVDLMTIE